VKKVVIISALAAIAATGCKIHVVVPEGADVVSTSGVYNCRAGQTCELEIDNIFFSEVFTVKPHSGYEFVGFGEGDLRMCGGREKPQCTLATTGFPGNPALMGILEEDTVFLLEPLVKPDGTVPLPSISPKDIFTERRVTARIDHYPVFGNTREAIRKSMDGDQNPLPLIYNGEKATARHNPIFDLDYSYDYVPPGTTWCKITSVKLNTGSVINMPELQSFPSKSKDVKTGWMPMYQALLAHEGVHAEYNRDAIEEVEEFFLTRGTFRCSDVFEKFNPALEAIFERSRQRNADFDVETNHGAFHTPGF